MAWPQAPRQLGKPLPGPENEGVFRACSAGVSRSGWTLLLSPGSRAAQASRLGERLGVRTGGGFLSVKAAGSPLRSDSALVLAGPAFLPGAAGQPRPALHGASGAPRWIFTTTTEGAELSGLCAL